MHIRTLTRTNPMQATIVEGLNFYNLKVGTILNTLQLVNAVKGVVGGLGGG